MSAPHMCASSRFALPYGHGDIPSVVAAVVAEVGDEVIPLAEVEQALSAQLANLEQQRFQLLQQKLEQLIGDRLLAQEAKKRRITLEQLLNGKLLVGVQPFAAFQQIVESELAKKAAR